MAHISFKFGWYLPPHTQRSIASGKDFHFPPPQNCAFSSCKKNSAQQKTFSPAPGATGSLQTCGLQHSGWECPWSLSAGALAATTLKHKRLSPWSRTLQNGSVIQLGVSGLSSSLLFGLLNCSKSSWKMVAWMGLARSLLQESMATSLDSLFLPSDFPSWETHQMCDLRDSQFRLSWGECLGNLLA